MMIWDVVSNSRIEEQRLKYQAGAGRYNE